MSPRVRVSFALAVAVLAGYLALAAVAVGAGLLSSIGERERDVLVQVVGSQAAYLVVAGLLVLGGLAGLVGLFFARYLLPLPRMAAQTRLMATVISEQRLPPTGPAELVDLAAAVNELADRHQAVAEGVEARVLAANADLATERNRFATLMSELTLPVLVCNLEGQILLYNAAARDLLGGSEAGADAGVGGYVGLGRSVFGVIDRSLVAHALDRIRSGSATAPSATTTRGGLLLRVRVAPVGGEGEGMTGFVLTVEDLTGRTAARERQSALSRTLIEGTRASLASIRAAVETVLDYPDMDAPRQRRFAEVIQDEAHRLSVRIDAAATADHITDRSLIEDVLDRDLLAAAAARLRRDPAVPVSVMDPVGELWLTVDGYCVVGAVADLVRLLRERLDVAAVQLDVHPSGTADERYAALDVRWQGNPLTPADLTVWTGQQPVHALLEQHAAEAWCGHDDAGAFVRILLPCADAPTPASPPARPATPPIGGRPEFYDFELFRAVQGESDWDERALGALAYTVFDTETTGLHAAEGDEIISIGAVRVVGGRLLRGETFEQLVDPRRSIPAASQAIHGISARMVRGQPIIEEVLPRFARFAEDTVLVGHEVGFDLEFLQTKQDRAGVQFGQPTLDTMLLSAVVHAEHPDHSLEAIASRLGVSIIGRHTALGDAIVTGEILVRLLGLLEQRGLRTLGEVRAAARRTALARRSAAIYPSG